MVSQAVASGGGKLDNEVAEKDWRANELLGDKADEDPLGYLQSQTCSHFDQPRAGEEADHLRGICCRPRALAFD